MKYPAPRREFDPKAAGADCSKCPLKGRTPVGPDPARGHPKLTIIGKFPGDFETAKGEPMVGYAGRKLEEHLRANGLNRTEVHITNALCCMPARKLSDSDIKQALKCCKPRLEGELKGQKSPIFTIGDLPLRQLTGLKSPTAWRGAGLDYQGRYLMPALMAPLIADPVAGIVFRTDMKRAIYESRLEWPVDKFFVEPGQAMLEALKSMHGRPLSVDIENIGDPLTKAHIRCIGVSDGILSVSVPVEELMPDDPCMLELEALLKAPTEKIMHNSQHDILGLDLMGWEMNTERVFDTLLAHASGYLQLPHDLGFVVSQFFPLSRWKSEHKVGEDDRGLELFKNQKLRDLQFYNCQDALATAWVVPHLRRGIELTVNGQEIYDNYMAKGELAIRMRRLGFPADRQALEDHRVKITAALAKERAVFEELVPFLHACPDGTMITPKAVEWLSPRRPGQRQPIYIGPYRLGTVGTHPDLKRLFFDRWDMTPSKYSETTEEPSLDDDSLATYSTTPGLIGKAATRVRRVRKYGKLLTTYIEGMPILPDGRVHGTWKVYGTVTGRWSSQDPNMQNLPPLLRNIFVAPDGLWVIAADKSALELRIAALLCGDQELLDGFNNGVNLHLADACEFFRRDVDKKERAYKLIKNLNYGSLYGAGAEKLWQTVLPDFPETELATVQAYMKFRKRKYPQMAQWQVNQLQFAEDNGYVENPISGMREWFFDRVDATKALNFPIQSCAGTLMDRAILKIDAALNHDDEHVVAQVHDEIVVLGRDRDRLCPLLNNLMTETVELNGNVLEFPSEVTIGRNYGAASDSNPDGQVEWKP